MCGFSKCVERSQGAMKAPPVLDVIPATHSNRYVVAHLQLVNEHDQALLQGNLGEKERQWHVDALYCAIRDVRTFDSELGQSIYRTCTDRERKGDYKPARSVPKSRAEVLRDENARRKARTAFDTAMDQTNNLAMIKQNEEEIERLERRRPASIDTAFNNAERQHEEPILGDDYFPWCNPCCRLVDRLVDAMPWTRASVASRPVATYPMASADAKKRTGAPLSEQAIALV